VEEPVALPVRAAVQRALGAPHAALGRLGDEERDVADEGVGMFARIADLATAGRAPGHAQ
jgi:hypothetical protein